MSDQTRSKLLDLIKDQGEVVRKLKTAKADSKQGSAVPLDINSELNSLNKEFGEVSFACDWFPTTKDVELYNFCREYSIVEKLVGLPHLKRWIDNIESYSDGERLAFPRPKNIDSTSSSSSIVEILQRLNKTDGNIDHKIIDQKVRQPPNAGRAATDSKNYVESEERKHYLKLTRSLEFY